MNGTAIASTPSFAGSNPAEVKRRSSEGTARARHARGHGALARRRLSTPRSARRPSSTRRRPTTSSRATTLDINPLSPAGLKASAMTPAQRDQLMKVIDSYAGLMAPDIAADRMAKIKIAGIENICVRVGGPIERGQKHYYRVQGPTFLIEFDNTQNDGNHVHSVWRDFRGRLRPRSAARASANLTSRIDMRLLAGLIAVSLVVAVPLPGDDSERILTIDHFVRVQSTVPAISGQPTQLYVRERVHAGTLARGSRLADRVVLFVHGAGTPAEVAFDVPYQDYSWMAYLAQAGFDAFSVDMTGYGRSTRPAAMNDPCNLAPAQQALFIPRLIPAPCPATYRSESDVDRLRLGRRWCRGGLHPRAAPRRARQPRRVVARRSALGWLRRQESAEGSSSRAARARRTAARAGETHQPKCRPMAWCSTRSRARSSIANWDRQVGCPEQYETAAADSRLVGDDRSPIRWAPRGELASVAPRRRRRGDGTPRS